MARTHRRVLLVKELRRHLGRDHHGRVHGRQSQQSHSGRFTPRLFDLHRGKSVDLRRIKSVSVDRRRRMDLTTNNDGSGLATTVRATQSVRDDPTGEHPKHRDVGKYAHARW